MEREAVYTSRFFLAWDLEGNEDQLGELIKHLISIRKIAAKGFSASSHYKAHTPLSEVMASKGQISSTTILYYNAFRG